MRNHLVCILIVIIFSQANAQHWAQMGSGINFNFKTIYTDSVDNVLYAGGGFSKAGGVNARGIAKWDGVKWDSLGTGMDDSLGTYPNPVYAICRYQNYIYAGGGFTTAGKIYSPNIARWNGTNWEGVSGPNGTILAMHVYNNELYVAGDFYSIGNIKANGIAKWDGTQWQNIYSFPFDSGVQTFENEIDDFTFYNGQLYICGFFNDSLGNLCEIAKYNGTHWDYFSFPGTFCSFDLLQVFEGELYTAGQFFKSEGDAGNNIMKWNGSAWSDVGNGTGGIVSAIYNMKADKNKLYVSGQFYNAGDINAQRIAIWDGIKWCSLGSTFNQPIYGLDFLNDTLYIGGSFDSIDGNSYDEVAKWIGGNYIDTCSIIFSGANNPLPSSTISIYPNPGTNYIQLANLPQQKLNYTIINILGRVKQSSSLTINNTSAGINVSTLPAGVYFIRLSGSSGFMESAKFVKE